MQFSIALVALSQAQLLTQQPQGGCMDNKLVSNKDVKLYNMIFPIWGMLLFPPLWVITVPFNFVIDSLVFIIAMNKFNINNKGKVYQSSILKIVFFGYLSDVIAALFIIGILMLFEDRFDILHKLHYEPATHPITFCIMAIVIALAGVLIYFFNNKFSFNKAELNDIEKHKLSLALAIFTAPYIFMMSLDFLDKIIPIY